MNKPVRPDATELLRQMASGERTAVSIVTEHLERLEANHARLNAAVHVFKDEALAEANNPRPGPLSGLPISIKETIGIGGQNITAGSKRMPPLHAQEDAPVVRCLRDAGAIILARSNVPEFAMAGETENLIYGRTNNPLDETRTAGGSSGGKGRWLVRVPPHWALAQTCWDRFAFRRRFAALWALSRPRTWSATRASGHRCPALTWIR